MKIKRKVTNDKNMRVILLIAVCFFCATQGLLLESEVEKQWNNYKHLYMKKRFLNPTEENLRRTIFRKKLEDIEEHNERHRLGLETYTLGVNKFTAYTEEEMKPFTSGLDLSLEPTDKIVDGVDTKKTKAKINIPDNFDWHARGMVTPVKDQGQCGSCWAFAAIGALEAHYLIKHGKNVSLSDQQLLDCVYHPDYISRGRGGCSGGLSSDAFTYIRDKGGINYESDYPYEAKESDCRSDPSKSKESYTDIRQRSSQFDEELMKQILYEEGPFVIYVNANFSGYSGGVFYNPYCGTVINHAMVAVGYGVENGSDYWLLKNSWGPRWGVNGYIKIARNRDNHCGFKSAGHYPIV